jgi:hypothetical protein
MYGIAGFVTTGVPDEARAVAKQMAAPLCHRRTDDPKRVIEP